MHLNRLLLVAALVAPLAHTQLYLLAGAADEKHPGSYAASLFRLDDGTLKLAADLVPQDVGTEWIGISYDWRKVVLAEGSNHSIIVIDFDKAPAVKRCKTPPTRMELDRSLIFSWLADAPGSGPSFDWFESGNDKSKDAVQGMNLDSSIPCEKSFAVLPPEAVRYIVTAGTAGPADGSSRPNIGPYSEVQSGGLTAFITKRISLDYVVPESFLKAIHQPYSGLYVNDSHVLMLGLANRQGQFENLVFRKRDETWHVFPVTVERAYIRGFGKYIAVTEIRARSARSPRAQEKRSGGSSRASGVRLSGPGRARKATLYSLGNYSSTTWTPRRSFP